MLWLNLHLENALELLLGKVADTNGANLALGHDVLEGLPGVLEGHVGDVDAAVGRVEGRAQTRGVGGGLGKGDGPMDEVEVEVVGAQVGQGLVNGLLDVSGRMVRIPQLRGQEDVLAGHARGRDAGAYLGLVVVGGSGVNMTVAMLESVLDGLGDLIRTGLLEKGKVSPGKFIT